MISAVFILFCSLVKELKDIQNCESQHYSQDNGRPSKPIRLMVGLLLLKQLENLSDERVVLQFKRNP
jgi:IS5 family transposase